MLFLRWFCGAFGVVFLWWCFGGVSVMVCDGGVFVRVFGFLAFGVVGLFGCVFAVVFYVFSVVVLVVVVVLCGRSASPQCVRCRKAASPCRLEGGKMCADVWQIKDEGRPF